MLAELKTLKTAPTSLRLIKVKLFELFHSRNRHFKSHIELCAQGIGRTEMRNRVRWRKFTLLGVSVRDVSRREDLVSNNYNM